LIALFRAAPEEDAEEEEEDDMVVGQAVEISNRNTTNPILNSQDLKRCPCFSVKVAKYNNTFH
jgi:hypothetical protein